jgi:hypothetical protein
MYAITRPLTLWSARLASARCAVNTSRTWETLTTDFAASAVLISASCIFARRVRKSTMDAVRGTSEGFTGTLTRNPHLPSRCASLTKTTDAGSLEDELFIGGLRRLDEGLGERVRISELWRWLLISVGSRRRSAS